MYVKTREHFYSCTKKKVQVQAKLFHLSFLVWRWMLVREKKRASRKSFRMSTKSELGREEGIKCSKCRWKIEKIQWIKLFSLFLISNKVRDDKNKCEFCITLLSECGSFHLKSILTWIHITPTLIIDNWKFPFDKGSLNTVLDFSSHVIIAGIPRLSIENLPMIIMMCSHFNSQPFSCTHDPSISSRRLASFIFSATTHIFHIKWITSFRYNIYSVRFLFFFSSTIQHTHVFLLRRRSFPASIFQCTVKSSVSA